MSNLDELLKDLNAVIEEEVDAKETESRKYYLKIRVFPHELPSQKVPSSETISFKDQFYDVKSFENFHNQPTVLYRRRTNETTNEARLVRQSPKSSNNCSHLYVEENLSDENNLSVMEIYLSYCFERVYYERVMNEEGEEIFSMYVDNISTPFNYSVASYRILIQEDISELTDNKIQQLVNRFCLKTGLPAYAKFAYMLQCSPYFNLYSSLNLHVDNVYDQMKKKMLSRDYLQFQEYLWTFNRVVEFQSIFEIVDSYDEAVRRVQEMETQFRNGCFKVEISNDDDEFEGLFLKLCP